MTKKKSERKCWVCGNLCGLDEFAKARVGVIIEASCVECAEAQKLLLFWIACAHDAAKDEGLEEAEVWLRQLRTVRDLLRKLIIRGRKNK